MTQSENIHNKFTNIAVILICLFAATVLTITYIDSRAAWIKEREEKHRESVRLKAALHEALEDIRPADVKEEVLLNRQVVDKILHELGIIKEKLEIEE